MECWNCFMWLRNCILWVMWGTRCPVTGLMSYIYREVTKILLNHLYSLDLLAITKAIGTVCRTLHGPSNLDLQQLLEFLQEKCECSNWCSLWIMSEEEQQRKKRLPARHRASATQILGQVEPAITADPLDVSKITQLKRSGALMTSCVR